MPVQSENLVNELTSGLSSITETTSSMSVGSGESAVRVGETRIGGSSVDSVFKSIDKFVTDVKSGTEQKRVVEEGNKVSKQMIESRLKTHIAELSASNIAANQEQARQLELAIKLKTLRPKSMTQDYADYDRMSVRLEQYIKDSDNLSISSPVEDMVNEWGEFLYDPTKRNHVDKARELASLMKESSQVTGQAKLDAETEINRIKNGTNTPEIVSLTLRMQDAFKTNGETFQEYVALKRKAAELDKTGGKLAGKDLRTLDIDQAIVTSAFLGHEGLLGILTGDVFDEKYRKDEGLNYTASDLKVLGAVRSMVDMMAKAYDGKGLGRGEVGNITSDRAQQVFNEAPDVLRNAGFQDTYGVSAERPVKLGNREITAAEFEVMVRERMGGEWTETQIVDYIKGQLKTK